MGKAIYEKKNRIAYITLDRPEVLNALDDEMNDELWAIWRDFNDDPSVAIAGVAVALELTLTGREVLADEALRFGLVSKVVPAEQVLSTAETYAHMILGNSQQAIRSAKETVLD